MRHRPATPKDLAAVERMIGYIARHHPDGRRALAVDTWGYNKTWMVGRVRSTKENGLKVTTWTHKYFTALSLGPWPIYRQCEQKNKLLERVGNNDLAELEPQFVASLPFALSWQRNLAVSLNRNLRSLEWAFSDLCKRLRSLSGEGAYSVLASLSGVKGYSKCLDFFVREALKKNTVPVDRHVHRLLRRFKLDEVNGPDLAVLLSIAGYRPRLVARAMYEQGLKRPIYSPKAA